MTPQHVASSDETPGLVCVVHGPKGGCGVSTMAAHLAWAWARRPDSPATVLVDFSTNHGGARGMLDLASSADLGTLGASLGADAHGVSCDPDFVRDCTIRYGDRLAVLPASERADEAGGLAISVATGVLQALQAAFRLVVVDTDPHYSDQTLAALTAADHVVLPTTGDIGALRAVRRTLEIYQRLGLDLTRVRLVLNQSSSEDPLDAVDLRRLLPIPVAAVIPRDRRMFADAMTMGQVVQRHAAHSPAVAPLHQLADLLRGVPQERPSGRVRRFFAGR